MIGSLGLIKFDRRADDASGAEAKPAAWAIRDRHGQYSDPSRDEAKIRRDCDYLNRDSSTPYYIGQGPYEVVPLAPLPATDDAVEEARRAFYEAATEAYRCAAVWDELSEKRRTKGLREQTDDEVDAGNAADLADMKAMEAYAALRREKGGGEAPTPADPTNHAPKANSADGCTEQKEP